MKVKKVWLLIVFLGLAQLAILAQCETKEDAGEEGKEEDYEEEDDDDNNDGLEVKEENGVLVLTDSNFDSFISEKDTVLLEFYAPWCGHCKQFAPEYEKIAKTLKENDPLIPVAKIDATAHSELASRFDVSGYPTIKILKKGQPVDYDGARTEEAIISRVKEVAQPDWVLPPEATLVLTNETFTEVVNNADIILVEFYAPWCGHCKKLAPEYEKAAQELSKHTPPIALAKVDATAETELGIRFGVSGYPTLKIFRKGKAFDYNGPREKYGIVNYMIEQAGPPSKQIQAVKQVQEFLKDGDDVIVIGVFSGEQDVAYRIFQDASTQYWRNKVLEVAKDFPEYTFAIADEEDYSSELKDLGLSDSGEEVNVAILDGGSKKKYAMEPEEFDSDTLREFVLSFKKGKLKPIVKSQPVPKNNKGPVKVVVGKTFEEIVMDPKKDVLIEFYAPWCGHCKKLEPVYNNLGKKYKNEKNLIIAKMDTTANDVPSEKFVVEGFPTIYFAPGNRKDNPIKFEGENRDLEGLSTFLERHATKLSSRSKDEL
ncbi:protein disulfide-isomerase A4 isoform X2 [Latimeria chalumnae]|uniref:protein disulfide-isomerase A4 isoform X2 n=1 Tax=Latimeria chalumnae TaxID=7897 RepID=UPI00313AB620